MGPRGSSASCPNLASPPSLGKDISRDAGQLKPPARDKLQPQHHQADGVVGTDHDLAQEPGGHVVEDRRKEIIEMAAERNGLLLKKAAVIGQQLHLHIEGTGRLEREPRPVPC